MRGVASPLRSQLLTQVLAQGGAQCAATLKRWAREKRAYRGEVFSEEEVDAAIASLQAAKAESFEPGPGLQVALRWPSWPPEALLAAARCAVAPQPPRGTAELLRGLFEAPGDVVLVAGQPAVRLGAHRPLLAHFSEALRLKFEGGYRDSKELLVEVEARPCVVRSAVEFLYTGRCVLDVSSLGDLLVLADYWQAAALSEAIQVCWYRLPIVHQLEVMSNLDENSIVPKAMVGALVNSLTASFKKASECFPSPHCWTLVKELQDWISRTPEQALARMRHWLSLEEDELQDAVESFLIKGIEAASSEEQRQLLMRRSLKVWLPEALQRHVVMRLIDGEKAVDDSGQFRFWLLWVTSGGLRSELLFMEVYSQLEMKLQEDLDELRRGQYLQGLQRSVGRQLADQSYFSDESAFWCRAKLPDIMLSQAIACFAAAATCGRPFPPLPCSMINCALEEALLKLEVTAVVVEGSKAVAGVYERKGSIFRREGHIKEPLELVYIEQSEGQKDINKFSIIWKGLPAEYKKARGLWAFQSPGNELSAPHALLLSRHDPWSDLGAHWWLNQGGSFQQSKELLVRIHKLSPQHAELLRRSLTFVDLRELAQVARVPVLREMCWEAQGSKQVEKEAGAPHGKAIGQREEEMSDWKEAARLFDDVASELCQLLGAMQGGDAELRRRLLAKKRRLESGDFLEAVKRLERR